MGQRKLRRLDSLTYRRCPLLLLVAFVQKGLGSSATSPAQSIHEYKPGSFRARFRSLERPPRSFTASRSMRRTSFEIDGHDATLFEHALKYVQVLGSEPTAR